MTRRHFTLEAANALLPTLAPRMRTALQLHLALHRAVDGLTSTGLHIGRAELDGEDPRHISDDQADALETARGLYEAIHEEIGAIEATGAEVRGLEHGLLDFWSYLETEGRPEVLLCWKLGEPAIAFYHRPEAGFAGRTSVSGLQFSAEPSHPETRAADSEALPDSESTARRIADATTAAEESGSSAPHPASAGARGKRPSR